jgi:hypothetical protein
VVRGFAPPAHDWLPGHRGVDLAAEPDEPVRAAGAGRVVFAGRVGAVGVVAVRHADGLETTYEPVRATVRAGTVVTAGELVGRMVADGSHCAPSTCLHWGLRRESGAGSVRGSAPYLDPLTLVGAGRVRLLPLLAGAGRGSWLVPAASGMSVGSSAVVVGWAVVTTRRRRRGVPPDRLPPDVVSLERARARRACR